MIRKIVFLSLIGIALSKKSANLYVDKILQNALPQELSISGLDPAPLSDFSTTFGVYQNVAFFIQGNLTNLVRVSRKGDCSGPQFDRGALFINCTFRFTQLLTAYQVIIRNGSQVNFPRSVGNMTETLASLVIEGRPQNYIGTVQNFKVKRLGTITPSFSPLPPELNKYLRILQEAYKAHVSTEVYDIIQSKFVIALRHALIGKLMPRS